ncbi:hypothetical protein [Nocardia niwae]|uniref:hypothetical protein n=1 Tax=Nocardia niwae TaxID=626084 RepID=UPI0012F4A0FF|nr:hypothetical protein [Nocardia niwae]
MAEIAGPGGFIAVDDSFDVLVDLEKLLDSSLLLRSQLSRTHLGFSSFGGSGGYQLTSDRGESAQEGSGHCSDYGPLHATIVALMQAFSCRSTAPQGLDTGATAVTVSAVVRGSSSDFASM